MAAGMDNGKYRKQLIAINTALHEILALRMKFKASKANTGKGAGHYENLAKTYKGIKTAKMAGDWNACSKLIDGKDLSGAREFAKTL